MHIFRVALFGHREIADLRGLEDKIVSVTKKLILAKEYVTFLVGRNGDFDVSCASVIKRVQREIGKDNSDITLVLPYEVKDIEYYEKYYDSIIIPSSIFKAHWKRAITLRNQWMVEEADLIIFYVSRISGGSYQTMKYAKSLGKNIINLCDEFKDWHQNGMI